MTPEEAEKLAEGLLKHLHGPNAETLYYSKNIIAGACLAAYRSGRNAALEEAADEALRQAFLAAVKKHRSVPID